MPPSALLSGFPKLLRISALLGVAGAPLAFAQPPPPDQPPPGYYPPPPPDEVVLSPLDQLLAPIALYPDPLISLILPAATFPSQVQDAAGFVQGGGDPSQGASLGWDASVQGVAHYPEVLAWMSANFDWTQQLGGAFASQPAAVMDAIQDLRQRAQAAGTLVSSPQQQVIDDGTTISIVPAQPQVIYVPQYDPAVVYVQQAPGYYPRSYVSWSQPYAAGTWLAFGFDWRTHAVYQGDWYDYRMQHGGWSRPVDYAQVQINVGGGGPMNHGPSGDHGYAAWHAPHNAPPPPPQLTQRGNGHGVSASVQARFAQPRVMGGAPPAPAGAVRVNALSETRGQRPAAAPSNPRPAPAHLAEPAGHPAGPPVRPAAPQPRPANEVRPEEARAHAVPPNPPHPTAPSEVRGSQTRGPAPAPQAPPPKKKPAPPTKEEQEKLREQQVGQNGQAR